MAGQAGILDNAEERARWEEFQWTDANAKEAAKLIARYPDGRQQSAVIPLLDLAQRQVGAETGTQGWLPIPVQEFVARELDMPPVRVLEVATFYTMFNLAPVGKYHVQVCGTTPCLLRGSDDVMAESSAFHEWRDWSILGSRRGLGDGFPSPDSPQAGPGGLGFPGPFDPVRGVL